MKNVITVLLAAMAGLVASASATWAGGSEQGSGGGGIVLNGKYLTFGSAKVPVTAMEDVPGLTKAVAGVRSLRLHKEAKVFLQRALLPSAGRTYYKVSKISDEQMKELLKKYQEIQTDFGSGELVLFAVTGDTATFLLPAFFNLTEVEQAAIVFHEGLWILEDLLVEKGLYRSKEDTIPYRRVVEAEVSFQEFLSRPDPKEFYHAPLYRKLSEIFHAPQLDRTAAAARDVAHGVFPGQEGNSSGTLKLRDLLGPRLMTELAEWNGRAPGTYDGLNDFRIGPNHYKSVVNEYWQDATVENPDVQTIKEFLHFPGEIFGGIRAEGKAGNYPSCGWISCEDTCRGYFGQLPQEKKAEAFEAMAMPVVNGKWEAEVPFADGDDQYGKPFSCVVNLRFGEGWPTDYYFE